MMSSNIGGAAFMTVNSLGKIRGSSGSTEPEDDKPKGGGWLLFSIVALLTILIMVTIVIVTYKK